MLACTRSLTKRDRASSRIFAGPGAQQIIIQRRPAFVAAVRLLPAEAPAAPRPDGFELLRRRCAWRTSSWPSVGAFAQRLLRRPWRRRRPRRRAAPRPGRCIVRRRPRPWCGRAPASSEVEPLVADGGDDACPWRRRCSRRSGYRPASRRHRWRPACRRPLRRWPGRTPAVRARRSRPCASRISCRYQAPSATSP